MPKIPTVQAVSASDLYWRLLLYGDTGSGKTSLAVTANLHPSMYPAVVVNYDGGLSSVAHLPNIRQVQVSNTDEMLAVLGQFLLPPDRRAEGYQDVKTVIVDSVSAWRDAALQEITDRNAKADAAKGKPRQLMIPQLQDYGQLSYTISSILHGLCQLPIHLVLTAGLEEERSGDGSTVLSAQPLVNPKLRQSLGYMMSYIWYTRQTDKGYRLLTLPRGVYKIKTRNPKFVQALERDTMERVPADQREAAKGWYALGLDDEGYVTPNVANLYQLYLDATASKV